MRFLVDNALSPVLATLLTPEVHKLRMILKALVPLEALHACEVDVDVQTGTPRDVIWRRPRHVELIRSPTPRRQCCAPRDPNGQ
jgi:hypothetical protein